MLSARSAPMRWSLSKNPDSPPPTTRSRGQEAEDYAAGVLESLGYVIVERNARTRAWELDIIGWEGDVLCFVEVRSTRSLEHGGPLATVTPGKQQRIVRGARAYLSRLAPSSPGPSKLAASQISSDPLVRFDVLGVWGEPGAYLHELVRGAFVAAR